VLKPYLLRRVKEDVEKSLPPKEETIIEVALTSVQKQFYRAIYERNTSFLFRGAKSRNYPSLMNVMMELRKCCNHPYLVRGVEERILSDIPPEYRSKENVYLKLIESSGKLVLLDKLLPRLYTQGHRVLIFSQMVKVLNILEDFLKYLLWFSYL
jgi:SNF2 family DNA or RNA helicase